ncbi:hypothetical protein [Moorena producens]|nr:hypothetical protein [Moorena producens]
MQRIAVPSSVFPAPCSLLPTPYSLAIFTLTIDNQKLTINK